jgi:hypothetical protein
MRPTRHLLWIIPLVILVLLALPLPIAERFTSPNQDGQYAFHPIRAYGLIVALLRASGSAQLGSSGKALSRAKAIFAASSFRPTQVKLLYFTEGKQYVYYTRAGAALTIVDPPRLVWEVWGVLDSGHVAGSPAGSSTTAPAEGPTSIPGAPTTKAGGGADVIGFLDYVTGETVGTQAQPGPVLARPRENPVDRLV